MTALVLALPFSMAVRAVDEATDWRLFVFLFSALLIALQVTSAQLSPRVVARGMRNQPTPGDAPATGDARQPARLKQRQALFMKEAQRSSRITAEVDIRPAPADVGTGKINKVTLE